MSPVYADNREDRISYPEPSRARESPKCHWNTSTSATLAASVQLLAQFYEATKTGVLFRFLCFQRRDTHNRVLLVKTWLHGLGLYEEISAANAMFVYDIQDEFGKQCPIMGLYITLDKGYGALED